ncbi:hypothetical protein JXJ21_22395, partial [candidate division KSB1 bacterium]|nr:hypothetical protein [candidate division KSB1 bacterium]
CELKILSSLFLLKLYLLPLRSERTFLFFLVLSSDIVTYHYYRRADIDLAYSAQGKQPFDGQFTLEMEAMNLSSAGSQQQLDFAPIDSTTAPERMLDSGSFLVSENADNLDFLFTIHTRNFTHPAGFSDDWNKPLLTLNLHDADNTNQLVSIQPIKFNSLVNFKKADMDTSFLVRLNIQPLKGRRV